MKRKKKLKGGRCCHIVSQKGLGSPWCILSSQTKSPREETWPLSSPQIQSKVKGFCIFSALLLLGGSPHLTKESGGGSSGGSPASLGLGLADHYLRLTVPRHKGWRVSPHCLLSLWGVHFVRKYKVTFPVQTIAKEYDFCASLHHRAWEKIVCVCTRAKPTKQFKLAGYCRCFRKWIFLKILKSCAILTV